ncbi:recombinase family protein [Streptomyces sp. ET3-23]|uniref:recombinase family protein n=1 Tax=Streptomyces sp. ET3-23 TaxID=2885643 RepID=UPI001D123A4C|nr:recombinase family protein [Streptomyces sp. ET3-23]MCC2279548.1 recombinase family protein [Streptomyces sp. ET3-23]
MLNITRGGTFGAAVAPEDTGPDDLELRGVPAGLPSPEELVKLHPDTPFLIAYSRISDDWRKHNKKKAAASAWAAGKGVANQHRRNDKNAARHGAIIVHRYTDNDLSASKRDVVRPDFLAMQRDLRRGYTPEGYRVDGVICVDQDRVQRTNRDWEDFVDALTLDSARRFYTPSGPMDLTEESEIIKTGVMAVVNKAESLKKKRRIRDWHQDRILDGLPHSGPRPFGWDDDRIHLRPAEADFLLWAIRERIKGKAVKTLCLEAKKRGLTGTRGGEIVPQTLTQMMTAPRVCGYRANRGELVLDDNGAPIVGVWETIATPEEWRAVCATFKDGSTYLARGSGTPRITGIPKTIKYLASSLLRCQRVLEDEVGDKKKERVCNNPMGGSKTNRSKRSPYNYTCHKCSRNAISGPMVDKQIELLLMAKLEKAQATYKAPEVVWPLEAQLKQKADKLAKLEAQWEADEISDEMFYRLAPKLETEVKKLRRERARFEMEARQGSEAPGDIMRKWKSGEYDLEQKRKVLFEVFAAIQVAPGEKGNKMPNPRRLTPIWKS